MTLHITRLKLSPSINSRLFHEQASTIELSLRSLSFWSNSHWFNKKPLHWCWVFPSYIHQNSNSVNTTYNSPIVEFAFTQKSHRPFPHNPLQKVPKKKKTKEIFTSPLLASYILFASTTSITSISLCSFCRLHLHSSLFKFHSHQEPYACLLKTVRLSNQWKDNC